MGPVKAGADFVCRAGKMLLSNVSESLAAASIK